jgi:hypothetical protein
MFAMEADWVARASKRREAVGRLRAKGLTYARIAKELGLTKSTVAYHARRLGIPVDEKAARRYNWIAVQAAIDEGVSMTNCMRKFGFCRASWQDAIRRGAIVPRSHLIPLTDLLVVGRRTSRGHLKRRLIKAGLKQNRCEECGLTEWRGKPLVMELHHINGNGKDNRLRNLKLLCGNCDSQTHSWGGKNKGKRQMGGEQKAA